MCIRPKLRWQWSKPGRADLARLQEAVVSEPLTYRASELADFTHARDEFVIAPRSGYAAAASRLQSVQHLDTEGLTTLVSSAEVGGVVTYGMRQGPLWLLCACRILALDTSAEGVRLTYGTLPVHGVVGQGRFEVFVDARGTVFAVEKWFRLPPIARIASPLVGYSQRAFLQRVSDGMRSSAASQPPWRPDGGGRS